MGKEITVASSKSIGNETPTREVGIEGNLFVSRVKNDKRRAPTKLNQKLDRIY